MRKSKRVHNLGYFDPLRIASAPTVESAWLEFNRKPAMRAIHSQANRMPVEVIHAILVAADKRANGESDKTNPWLAEVIAGVHRQIIEEAVREYRGRADSDSGQPHQV